MLELMGSSRCKAAPAPLANAAGTKVGWAVLADRSPATYFHHGNCLSKLRQILLQPALGPAYSLLPAKAREWKSDLFSVLFLVPFLNMPLVERKGISSSLALPS